MESKQPRKEDVLVEGPARVVAYARDASGCANAQAFLDDPALPRKERDRLLRSFGVIAATGLLDRTHFRKEVGEVWAFKAHQARIGAFFFGRVIYLTHGFTKKKDRWPTSEIERAERIRREHLARGPR